MTLFQPIVPENLQVDLISLLLLCLKMYSDYIFLFDVEMLVITVTFSLDSV